MAPKRKRGEVAAAKPIPTTTRETRSMTRKTRSATRKLGETSKTGPYEFTEMKKKGKAKAKASPKGKAKVEDAKEEEATEASKTIVIEACKQCQSFKKRADQVKNGLKKNVSGITVLVNPEKPRKGCFVIREEGGDTFINLLDMERPYPEMKALDMDDVIADIVEKIK